MRDTDVFICPFRVVWGRNSWGIPLPYLERRGVFIVPRLVESLFMAWELWIMLGLGNGCKGSERYLDMHGYASMP